MSSLGSWTSSTGVIAAWLAAALLCGCARTLTFRVVDADTREPLAGVVVQQSSMKYNYLLGGREIHRDLPATGADGLVVIDELDRGMSHSFAFRKEGRRPAYAVFPADGSQVGVSFVEGRNRPDVLWNPHEVIEVPLTRDAKK